jgi:hypothetical protein
MSKGRAHGGALTPLAEAEVSMAAAARKGRGQRVEAGGEVMAGTQRERAHAEHRADLNVGSVGTRRGRRGHRGIGQ